MSRQMVVASSLGELATALSLLDHPLGLVPTMGYLHEGHLSLARRAREECRSVAVSIFVNPTQFGPGEDLSTYPRDLERDLHLLEAAQVDLVWTPTPEIMYPRGFQTWVEVTEVGRPLEGEQRPGHFRGVTTVVSKLFHAVQPARAYFGQKDAQQAAVIQQMTRDLNFPVEIVVCPTVREPDGLALSSRNTYLTPEQRRAAPVLHRALLAAREAYANGERQAEALRRTAAEVLSAEPLAQVQYVSCADPETLQELEHVGGKALLSLAVFFGKTRLIDNLVLG
jgi:pantoate--beta-alanine ligase